MCPQRGAQFRVSLRAFLDSSQRRDCFHQVTRVWQGVAYRYVSVVRITPEGLEVNRGRATAIHPWATVGEIDIVPFVQPALWKVTFRDGFPTAAFFTEGSSWMLFGVVKARSKLVDEIRRLAEEAIAGGA